MTECLGGANVVRKQELRLCKAAIAPIICFTHIKSLMHKAEGRGLHSQGHTDFEFAVHCLIQGLSQDKLFLLYRIHTQSLPYLRAPLSRTYFQILYLVRSILQTHLFWGMFKRKTVNRVNSGQNGRYGQKWSKIVKNSQKCKK